MKYNYTYIYNNPNDGLLGSSIISADAKNLAICFVEGNYMYLCNTAEGIYYRANYKDADVKVKQINGVKMQTSTDYYMPRVVGNYFIGSYSSAPFFKYIYVVDMTDIDNDEAYEKYLEDVAVKDAETIYNLSKTMIGKMNETDAKAFETYFETNYPNFDLEEQE